jgi:putative tricarboxylic transport membrane protein
MKNMNPGSTLFTNNPQNIYAVYLLFIIAYLIMIPLGWWCIRVSKQILKVPRSVLMPVIMLFCVVGSFAINNTAFDVTVMLVAGVAAFFWRRAVFRWRRRYWRWSSAACLKRTSSVR